MLYARRPGKKRLKVIQNHMLHSSFSKYEALSTPKVEVSTSSIPSLFALQILPNILRYYKITVEEFAVCICLDLRFRPCSRSDKRMPVLQKLWKKYSWLALIPTLLF